MLAFSWLRAIRIIWRTETIQFFDRGYARVKFPDILVLKENAAIKLLVDDKGPLLATAGSNTYPLIDPIASFWC